MAIDVVPTYDVAVSGGEGSNNQLQYNIYGTDNESEAFYALVSNMNPLYGGQFPSSARVERKAETTFLGVVEYRAAESPQISQVNGEPAGSSLQFELSTDTQHITQSLSTITSLGFSGMAPAADYKGAINVTSDGVEGLDILTPTFSWSETHYYPARAVGKRYINTLHYLCSKMNAAPFRDFASGEVLFAGASGGFSRDNARWELTYKFLTSRNATNIDVGGIIIPSKLGWDYLWVEYVPQDDATAKKTAQVPRAVYVERVYEFGDFRQLALNN